MFNDYYSNVIKLKNGAWIGSKNLKYDFFYNDNLILAGCTNFSYISGKLVCLKKDSKIIVYSMNIVNLNGNDTPEKLLEFVAHSKLAYGKIICERYTYLIDGNCQIKFNERSHLN